eukprot:157146-Chlamydomonas_euryale.AAC.5
MPAARCAAHAGSNEGTQTHRGGNNAPNRPDRDCKRVAHTRVNGARAQSGRRGGGWWRPEKSHCSRNRVKGQ